MKRSFSAKVRGVLPALLTIGRAVLCGDQLPAQEPPPVAVDSVVTSGNQAVADSLLAPPPVTPGGAFLRAVLVPGWGHASIGSHTRGGFYFALETGIAYTLIRTRKRISGATARADFREVVLRADLAAQGITDLAQIDDELEDDAALADLRSLTDSRRQQQEDLVAFGLFLLFLSGADAFVSAHLQDFPEPIEIEGGPAGGGRFELGLRLRLPN